MDYLLSDLLKLPLTDRLVIIEKTLESLPSNLSEPGNGKNAVSSGRIESPEWH
ncbi:MAG: hypothetical protein WC716_00180 [Chitinophagaceae bacterium]|jgi:hypothetical protein